MVESSLAKFKSVLAEVFMLDQADLDFGIYRIMNAKREEIGRFLDNDLLPQVRRTLGSLESEDRARLETELAKATEQANALGIDPDTAPRVKELQARYASVPDVVALENEVFSDLASFFRRYYDKGDFLSLRRYKEGVYAIPYEGEEVKLHWANADQYYIKTSEYFRDYAFKLPDGRRVHFKLAAADTEENNNKPANGKERRFILAENDAIAEENGDLVIRFEYRPDDAKRRQTELNAEAAGCILATQGLGAWLAALSTPQPTEKNPTRTLLDKRLADYTARNTFDYFIHKDLGGFLRRELDFYIKNEVMHLDDVESESVPHVEQYLGKIKAIRRIGHKIIDFLAQLEGFQKKLWLKKKLVVETNYCVTLDRVPEELYPEITANEAQREEWVRLFAIDDIKGDMFSASYSVPLTVEFLKGNPFLVLDTRFFEPEFKDKLLASFDDLDGQASGLLVHGENFQAISLLQARFMGRVKCIYIDPPYNTGQDDFVYKDNYQHSSWLSMLDSRLSPSVSILGDDGLFLCSLNDDESASFERLVANGCYGLTRLGKFIWRTRNTDNRVVTQFSVDHEYVHVYARPSASLLGRLVDRSDFKNPDNDPRGPYVTDPLTGKANAVDRPNLHYDIVNRATGDKYFPHPDFGWITNEEGFARLLENNLVAWPANPRTGNPRKKRFASESNLRTPISSLAISIKQGEGNRDLSSLFGGKLLNFPKPVSVIRTLIDCTADREDLVLDYFGGSGTTGHAIVNLNREDGGKRKYVLVYLLNISGRSVG